MFPRQSKSILFLEPLYLSVRGVHNLSGSLGVSWTSTVPRAVVAHDPPCGLYARSSYFPVWSMLRVWWVSITQLEFLIIYLLFWIFGVFTDFVVKQQLTERRRNNSQLRFYRFQNSWNLKHLQKLTSIWWYVAFISGKQRNDFCPSLVAEMIHAHRCEATRQMWKLAAQLQRSSSSLLRLTHLSSQPGWFMFHFSCIACFFILNKCGKPWF